MNGNFYSKQCAKPNHHPCIFEYVYLARPDSVIDGISVYQTRLNMGKTLAQKIKKAWAHLDIDVVIPIPDTSRPSALQLALNWDLITAKALLKIVILVVLLLCLAKH